MSDFEVLFQPDGLRIRVPGGTLLTEAMKAAGFSIQLACAGTGKCGKCTVEIHPDPPEPNGFDRQHLTADELARGVRLACQTRIDRPMSVLISPGIRVLDGRILVDGIDRVFKLNPSIAKTYTELPEPTLEDQTADLLRIKRALDINGDRCPDFDIDLVRNLYRILRTADFKVTVVTSEKRVVDVEPGDTTGRLYGIAFDIGTTTVVGTVIELMTGREVSHASRLNAQVVYGEDTISRIKYAIENPNGRRDLAEKIQGIINEIVAEAAEKAGIDSHEIYEAVFVGNTTMSHLFLGFNPEGLSMIPFVPVTNAPVNLRAIDAGVGINPRGNIYVLPGIAGFVGSDTVGVMLACNYLEPGPVQLAVDIGTNGELVLRNDTMLMVCSTAAGPALEGAALSCGMRAANGAIEHLRITPDAVEYDVIGDSAPIGLCGSGIIDIVAELLETGIVDTLGRIQTGGELAGKIPDYLLDHIITLNNEPAFLICRGAQEDKSRRDVFITQRDIRQIQLAKGAISSGIILILKQAGLTPDDLDEILLAGAFGNYIKKSSARRIGLLPAIPAERIRFVGNAASTGAKMALLSRDVRDDADRIRAMTKHLELAALPEFMNVYTDSMLFP
ncbi:ASKHA domain-containing protein [bacterium]|nr:ASKHA domain-containing protein [bacterium]